MSSSAAGGAGVGPTGPCGACKFLRRKCVSDCIFAPYFGQDQGAAHFAAVHKVFGASNVSKLLNHIPKEKRVDAVSTVCYEAQARLRDPVYGCVSHIFALQQQIVSLQSELRYMQNHQAAMEQQSQEPFPVQSQIPMPGAFSISNLPVASNIEANVDVDLSCLFDEQASQQLHQQQYVRIGAASGGAGGSGTSISDTRDLHDLARELLNRHGQVPDAEPTPKRTHQ